MLTIELTNSPIYPNCEVEIYCDLEGLRDLQTQLNFLLNGESHVHLATPAWAGIELTEEKQGENNTLINQLTIIRRSI